MWVGLDIGIFLLPSADKNLNLNGRHNVFWLKNLDERGNGIRKLRVGT